MCFWKKTVHDYYQDGLNSYLKNDYANAIRAFEQSSATGNTKAKVLLGQIYYYGRGVDVDYSKAFSLFEGAKKSRDPFGSLWCGICYEKGNGVVMSPEQAQKLYRSCIGDVIQSINAGYLIGSYDLANCYRFGRGVEKDYEKAAYYYNQALKEYPFAQYDLAECYLEALKDRQKWWHDIGDIVDQARSTQLTLKVTEYIQKIVKTNDFWLKMPLACLYYTGNPIKITDKTKTIREPNESIIRKKYEEIAALIVSYYKNAAEIGIIDAKIKLADLYYKGDDLNIAKNYKAAVELYESAESDGSNYASVRLGKCYVEGNGVDAVDFGRAKQYFLKAAKNGYPEAGVELARIYTKPNAYTDSLSKEDLIDEIKVAVEYCVMADNNHVIDSTTQLNMLNKKLKELEK